MHRNISSRISVGGFEAWDFIRLGFHPAAVFFATAGSMATEAQVYYHGIADFNKYENCIKVFELIDASEVVNIFEVAAKITHMSCLPGPNTQKNRSPVSFLNTD